MSESVVFHLGCYLVKITPDVFLCFLLFLSLFLSLYISDVLEFHILVKSFFNYKKKSSVCLRQSQRCMGACVSCQSCRKFNSFALRVLGKITLHTC